MQISHFCQFQNNPTSVSDIVILITDGKTPTVNTTKLFTMIENHQKAVGRSISHVVFSLEPSTEQVKHILTNIAEQHVPNWPVVSFFCIFIKKVS